MTFEELFELESYLTNTSLSIEHFDLKVLIPVKTLTGKTKFGVWDEHKLIGRWIVATTTSAVKANDSFMYILTHFSLMPKVCHVLMIMNNMDEFKILIGVDETK